MSMRPQYHFRSTEKGLLAWNVCRLIGITADLHPKEISLRDISELNEKYWFDLEGS